MTQRKRRPKAKAGRKPRKKKTGEKRRNPTPRQAKLIEGIVAGQSTRQAALTAGYSERMADHAGELLSSEVLRGFLQRRLSLEKISDRIDEGMDATIKQTLIIGSKLKGTEQVVVNEFIDYGERRMSAALAAKLIGADPSAKIEDNGSRNQNSITVNFVHVATLQEA